MASDDGRSFKMASLGLTAFLSLMIVYCIHSVYADLDESMAVAFRKAIPQQVYQATALDSGYLYKGSCAGVLRGDGGMGDSACTVDADVDRRCAEFQNQEYPVPEGAVVYEHRRLRATPVGVNASTLEERASVARRLPSIACQNLYVPWVKVSFTVPAANGVPQTLTRCAYAYGTVRNSGIHDFRAADAEAPHSLQVWTSQELELCVVGTVALTALGEFVDAHELPGAGLWPLMAVFATMGACSLIFCAQSYVESSATKAPPTTSGSEDELQDSDDD